MKLCSYNNDVSFRHKIFYELLKNRKKRRIHVILKYSRVRYTPCIALTISHCGCTKLRIVIIWMWLNNATLSVTEFWQWANEGVVEFSNAFVPVCGRKKREVTWMHACQKLSRFPSESLINSKWNNELYFFGDTYAFSWSIDKKQTNKFQNAFNRPIRVEFKVEKKAQSHLPVVNAKWRQQVSWFFL